MAHAVEERPWFRVLARSGYVANGLVHLLLGALILAVAVDADSESDQTGAFKAIASAPLGFLGLWALAVGLTSLALWQVVQGILMRRGPDEHRVAVWGRRAGAWGQAVIFITLAAIAAAVALGARPDAEETTESASSLLLRLPGGGPVLGLAGVAIGIAGGVFVVMGVRRSFRNRMSLPPGTLGTALTVLGVVGFVAKGIALAIVGVLLVVAFVTVDAETAGGLDGAVHALLGLMLGPALVIAVGGGFLAYGVFTVFRARYARLTWR